jgi:hypothetical protein
MLNVLVGCATVFNFYVMVSHLNIAYVSEHERMQNLRQGLFSGLMFAVGMAWLIVNATI